MEEHHEDRDLDRRDAGKGIWLVKVPKYLSDAWKNCQPGSQIGNLSMNKNKMSEVMLSVSDRFVKQGSNDAIPQDFNFNIKKVIGMNRTLLSTIYKPSKPSDPADTQPMVKARIRGKIMHKCECKPNITNAYINLQKVRTRMVNQPQKQVVTLDKAPRNYKPVKNHDYNIEYDRKKKEDGKRIRLDKDLVLDVLFKAFEKHQYYSIKDLVTITSQPMIYLKEILNEICTYRVSAPNKNTWELKPEYRCYKKEEGGKEGGDGKKGDDEDDDDDEEEDDFEE